MTIAYLTTQGASLTKEGEVLYLEKDKERISTILVKDLSAIVIFGHISISPPALDLIFKNAIPVSFISVHGRYKGKIAPAGDRNVPLRIKQYALINNEQKALSIAKAIINAKIQNAVALLQSYLKNYPQSPEVAQAKNLLKESLQQIPYANNFNHLRGIEGNASRIYFNAFRYLCRGELKFHKRSRHPAQDPINAVLNFSYGIVLAEISALISGVGLDPDIGIFHQIKYSRPALALDILEEFRAPLADRLSLYLNNNRILKNDDFHYLPEEGCRFKDHAIKKFIGEYEKFLTKNPNQNFRLLFRKQAERLRKTIQQDIPYQPFIWRE